jgi:hypothetical protein
MASVTVYRYDYFDPVLKCQRRSVDYATGDAIMQMHGTILSDTVQYVDEEMLGEDGTIRAMHVFAEPVVVKRHRARADTRRAA